MKKYIALIYGIGEGCDYTIGCNINWEIIEANSAEEVKKIVIDNYDEICFREYKKIKDFEHYEFKINTIEIFELSDTKSILFKINEELLLEFEEYKKKLLENPERLKYEKLKKKFE